MPIITLLSDLGTKDSYVAQMKGVILDICPDCQIVDITHEVGPQNITMGSFLLETTVDYFPPGTVHMAVVDPGVGSGRFPLVVKCRGGILVGPDNGLLVRAALKLGFVAAYRIQRPELRRPSYSSTFHGRDMFAITAGRLVAGLKPERVGARVFKMVGLEGPRATVGKGSLKCQVLHVDGFGNVITNAENGVLGKLGARPGHGLNARFRVRSFQARYVETYSDVRRGELAVLRGSQGYVEVAVREGSAAALLKVGPLDKLEIRLVR